MALDWFDASVSPDSGHGRVRARLAVSGHLLRPAYQANFLPRLR